MVVRKPKKPQGQILAVWILAAKLPNFDLNFAVDFGVDFFLLFSRLFPPAFPQEKGPVKSNKKSRAKLARIFVQKNSPWISAEAFT